MRRSRPAFLLPVALLLLGVPCLGPEARGEPPYPAGRSTHEIEGLQTTLDVPRDASAEKPASLVVVLHGYGGTASGMAGSLAAWAADGYVVCAPQASAEGWDSEDLGRVLAIAAHLKASLPIDPDRVHVVGFSNGGWNLAPLAFSDELKPRSATWVAAGFKGGQVPDWARKRLGAIALAGTEDGNVSAARQTVPALEEKVRTVEVRTQEGLGHSWPSELMPYLQWWMGVQEGRFTPGLDRSFAWTEDLEAALAALEGAKKGGVLVYVFSPADAESEDAKALQNEVFFDPVVRFLGQQLACVKLEREAHAARVEALGVKATPAVAVLDRKGLVKKLLAGEVSVRKLVSALKAVAPVKAPPRR